MSSATGAAYATAVQTPTATVTPGREWDGQSVHSDTLSSTTTLVANGTPAIAQGTSVEYLRDLVQKRIITLTYMRNVHEGCVGFFRKQVSCAEIMAQPESLVPYNHDVSQRA